MWKTRIAPIAALLSLTLACSSSDAPDSPQETEETPELAAGAELEVLAPTPSPIFEDVEPVAPVQAPMVADDLPEDSLEFESPESPALDAPEIKTTADASLHILDLGVGTQVRSRKLEGRADAFDASVGKVYAWIQVRNAGEPAPVFMVWKRQGEEVFRLSLDIGTSASWRTWSSKNVARPGAWTVEVQNPARDVLASASFVIQE